ncbi:protein of unknown function DUF1725 containing protein [Cricetulus griseus]|nr:protein of unknown function DUF1725 containing protein [Cricetulus griseus]
MYVGILKFAGKWMDLEESILSKCPGRESPIGRHVWSEQSAVNRAKVSLFGYTSQAQAKTCQGSKAARPEREGESREKVKEKGRPRVRSPLRSLPMSP